MKWAFAYIQKPNHSLWLLLSVLV